MLRPTGIYNRFRKKRSQGDRVLNQRLGDTEILRKFCVSGERI